MKKLILLFSISLFAFHAPCQNKIISDSIPVYEGIIEAEGTKTELFNALKEWVVLSFNSANDVIQLSDITTCKIIIKGTQSYNIEINQYPFSQIAYFTLALESKDNRFKYRLEFTDIKDVTSRLSAPIEEIITPDAQSIDNLKFVGKKYKQKAIESQNKTISQHKINIENTAKNIIENLTILTTKKEDW